MIVGLTGKFAAGKGTVAAFLSERGFSYHSLSDILREELGKRGVAESRVALTEIGNELRTLHGPSALAVMLSARLTDGGDHIVDSIRNPGEVEVLRELDGFFLLGVDADARTRFERLVARGRQGDPETFEEFARLEALETESTDPTNQRLGATFAMADEVVFNDESPVALQIAVEAVLARRR